MQIIGGVLIFISQDSPKISKRSKKDKWIGLGWDKKNKIGPIKKIIILSLFLHFHVSSIMFCTFFVL